jgi:hypothetical protein
MRPESSRFSELSVSHMPCVALAAHRAWSAHLLVADAKQRPDLAVNSDVDFLPGIGADKVQPLHAGSRWLEATLAPNLIAVRGKNLPTRSRSGEQKTFLYDPLIWFRGDQSRS